MSYEPTERAWRDEWAPHAVASRAWTLAYDLGAQLRATPPQFGDRWLVYAQDRGYQLEYSRQYSSHSFRGKRFWRELATLRETALVYLDFVDGILWLDRVNDNGTWGTGILELPDSFARWMEVTSGLVNHQTMMTAAQPCETGYFCARCTEVLDPMHAVAGIHPGCEDE